MSTKKIISYILCNKGIRINLYKLHFLSFNLSPQPNKRIFHPSHFFTPTTKHIQGKIKIFYHSTFSSSYQFFILLLFHSSNQIDPN